MSNMLQAHHGMEPVSVIRPWDRSTLDDAPNEDQSTQEENHVRLISIKTQNQPELRNQLLSGKLTYSYGTSSLFIRKNQ